MNLGRQSTCWSIAAIAAFLCAAPLRAQQEGDEKPKAAARVLWPLPDLNSNQQDADQSTQTMQPDNGPVTGVQSPTLGTSELRHSYWVPGIQYGNFALSSPVGPTATPEWTTTSFVSGNLSLLEAWSRNMLAVNYSGGGYFSKDQTQGNGQFQQLSSAFEIDQRRWQALFVDQFSYLPQSSFGFGGVTGLAFPGITGVLAVPLPQLQSVFVPGQSILSAGGPRYSNAGAAQLTYMTSKRGSITVAGIHALLRFVDPGNIDSDNVILNAGYNYALTRKDHVGLVYRFSAFHYPSNPQAMGDHSALFVYGRRITGRLALNLAGGPEVTEFRVPVGGVKQSVSGTGTGSLVYAFPMTTVTLVYSHGITSGSGLFSGSRTDLVNASLFRSFHRVWSGNLSFGYAENRQIIIVKGLPSPSYSSWLPSVGIGRPLGSNANFSLGYQAQIQSATVLLCGSPNCGRNYTTHAIQLNFQWHAAPLVLR